MVRPENVEYRFVAMMEAAFVDRRTEFCEGARELFVSFAGQQVESASCTEMAFCGEESTPKFEHPNLPFIQAIDLEFLLSGGRRVHVQTWMERRHEMRAFCGEHGPR